MSTPENNNIRKAASNTNRTNSSQSIGAASFIDIWYAFLRFKWLILILIIVLAVGGYFYTRIRFVPMYESKATFTVSTRSTSLSSSGLDEYSFYYTLNTAEKLARAFPSILSSSLLQNKVMEELGVSYMPASISASTVEGSNLFTMTARGSDPEMVYRVLMSAIQNMPDASKHVLGGIQLKIISAPDGQPTECCNKSDALKSLASGAGIGFLIGIIWVLLFVWFRKTIRSREDIRKNFNLETVGMLPVVTFKNYKMEIDRSVLITNKRVNSSYKESVRVFRNTVINKLKEGENVLMTASTAPGEGKSTVSCNLALSLVDIGKKVLIMDADLRKPTINTELGLTDADQEIVVDDPMYTLAYVSRLKLYVLNFKTKTNRYWKIMNTAYLHPLIGHLRREYDYVLIDTPPVGLISDPIVISQEADVALYVIMQDTIRISRIRNSILTLSSANVRILGCVMNGTFTNGVGYGYGYGYGRYGRYGYGKYGYGGNYGHNGRYGYGEGYGYGRYGKSMNGDADDDSVTPEGQALSAPEIKE